ncbi:hypothetical protein HanHA89_Chr16g0675901 [Helianthus annuus]|nr:hypothetical protein HanHA89_Chr16g0675901 [Helianthus annuus]
MFSVTFQLLLYVASIPLPLEVFRHAETAASTLKCRYSMWIIVGLEMEKEKEIMHYITTIIEAMLKARFQSV